eukprot:1160808-Pelagomonas_calceolata.AAC.29
MDDPPGHQGKKWRRPHKAGPAVCVKERCIRRRPAGASSVPRAPHPFSGDHVDHLHFCQVPRGSKAYRHRREREQGANFRANS